MAVLPPPITNLPAAPQRKDGKEVFNQRADPFMAALPPMTVQLNASFTWVATRVNEAEAYKNAAASSAQYAAEAADRAEAVDTNVSEQVTAAQTAAINAAASATAAESAQGSIGNLALLHAVALSF